MKEKQLRNQRGITLIALVVTIIVLIVLAGIAISMTVGDSGIFTKAKEAKRLQITAEAKEKIGTEILAAQVEAIERNEELEQAQVEDIISKYGTLQDDKDTIILNDNGYDIKLSDIYQGTITTSGSYTENKAKIELLKGQIKNLEEQLEKMTEENTKNKTEIENLNTEIETLKADVERQKELLESMTQSGDEKDKKIAELNEKVTAIEKEKNDLNSKNNELKNENSALTSKATELETLKDTLSKVTASESKILKNYTAYKDGKLITGTMANYAGQTQEVSSTRDATYTYLSIPNAGYYGTDSKLKTLNSNLSNEFGFVYLELTYSAYHVFYIGDSNKERTITIGSYLGQNGRTTITASISKTSDMANAVNLFSYGENVNISNASFKIPVGYRYMSFKRGSVSGTSTSYMRDVYIK